MAAIGGLACSIDLGSGYESNETGWTIDYNQDAIETTSADTSGARTFVPGLTTWSGSFNLRVDDTVTVSLPTAALTATFYANAGQTFAGSIIITGVSTTIAVDGDATVACTFQGTAALAIA